MPVPHFAYAAALERVLAGHTDVVTAENTVQRARYNLRLAQVTPVPDVNLHLAIEKDFSMPPFAVTHSIQLGVPVPVWDQNKGNIIQAQGTLLRAVEEAHRVRDDLTNRLAAAFEQYENNRVLLEYYRDQILPDQVRAYRGIYLRYVGEQQATSPLAFGDVVQAQQTLVTTVTTYVTTLGSFWTAVVGVADLLQTDDLFQVGPDAVPTQWIAPVPDLQRLLPCCHPCTPLPDPALKGANGSWPPAVPANAPPATPPAPAPGSGRVTEPTRGPVVRDVRAAQPPDVVLRAAPPAGAP
jgi:cobalt-zinc-cadmium efflux system outer membrane protein